MFHDRSRLTMLLFGWVLLTPPYATTPQDAWLCTGCADPGHLNDGAPLSRWRLLGSFEDAAACRHARDARIVAATSDEEWSDMQVSRCFPEDRVSRGRLRPGE